MVDAFAGFGGGGGAGSSHVNVAAYGGQYGVYFDQSEPGPVVAGSTFVNQTVSGVRTGPDFQGPLVLVGVRVIQPTAGASGAAIDGAGFVIDSVIECGCATRTRTGTGTHASTSNGPRVAGGGGTGSVAIGWDAHTGAGAYVARTYSRGCRTLAAGFAVDTSACQLPIGDAGAASGGCCGDGSEYTVANELASGSMWWDGTALPNASIVNVTTAGSVPDGMTSQHVGWDEATFPSFERRLPDGPVADAMLDCGAKGDGAADDTSALQACLDNHREVFLPKGLFRVSATLNLSAGGSLVGLSQVHSIIAPTSDFYHRQHPATATATATAAATAAATATATATAAAAPAAGTPTLPPPPRLPPPAETSAATAVVAMPLVRTAAGSRATLAYLGLVTWWHVPHVFTLDWRSRGGLWRSNYETRVPECQWLSDYGSGNTAHGQLGSWPPAGCKPAVKLTVPKTLVRGTGRFYNYVSDEDVVMTDHRGYRHLLITNTTASPTVHEGSVGGEGGGSNGVPNGVRATHTGDGAGRLSFYAINLEHSMAETNAEVAGATAIDIYGLKKEGSTPIVWIHDSHDVNIFGAAGGYTAMENASQYPADFRPYTPSDYRVERSSPIKLVGIGAVKHNANSNRNRNSHTDSHADRHADSNADSNTSGGPHAPRAKVKCSYPLDRSQLAQVYAPAADSTALIESLWAPWCGYNYPNTLALLEADGVGVDRVKVGARNAGVMYMRGYPKPNTSSVVEVA
jgi:hypothetical protein